MKKTLILLLILGISNCSADIDKFPWVEGEMIWVNQSDHTIQMVSRWNTQNIKPVEEVLFDKTLQKGEKFEYVHEGGGGYTPQPELMPFSSVTVRFDELPEITYVPIKAYPYESILSPPEGYPEEYNLFRESNYEKEVVKTDGGYLTTYTFTYTFTDADYEAAREWAERQENPPAE